MFTTIWKEVIKEMEKKTSENKPKQPQKREPWNKIRIPGEELNELITQYFNQCDQDGRRATKPGLAVFCGISTDTYDKWKANKDGKYTKQAAALKRAELVMSDRLQQESNASAIFLLKQPCYGGYSDRGQEDNGPGKLTIEILSNGTKIN